MADGKTSFYPLTSFVVVNVVACVADGGGCTKQSTIRLNTNTPTND